MNEPALPTSNRSHVIIHEFNRSIVTTASLQSIECHLHKIETRSIFAGGVGRVRSQLMEFSDVYLHKPAPTDLIKYDRSNPHPYIRMYGFVGAGLWNRFRIILKI